MDRAERDKLPVPPEVRYYPCHLVLRDGTG